MYDTSLLNNERILEAIPALILVWDASGSILPGFSKLSKQILGDGRDLSGQDIDRILCDGDGTLTNLNSILFGCDSDIDFESLIELAPDELVVNGSTYKLIYQQVFEDNRLVGVMAYGRDISAEKMISEQREKEVWQNAMLLEIIKDRSLFQTFYTESIKSLHKASKIVYSRNLSRDSIDELFRIVHSIKGSGSSFKIKTLMHEAHELEHELDLDRKLGKIDDIRLVERGLMKLEKILTRTNRQVISVAGEYSEKIKQIDDDEIYRLKDAFASGDSTVAEEIFDGLSLPQLKYYIEDRAQSVFSSTLEQLEEKRAELVLELQSMRVPPKIIEVLEMSLPHLIRNSLDHGLEEVENREKAGKSREGKLTITAVMDAGDYLIELIDDGRGVNPDIVGKIAVSKGVLTQSELEQLTVQERQELIFAPGFSTAEEISEISGRGVGMDSVKMKIEEIEGTIELKSEVGTGSRFTIRIPINFPNS